MSEPNDIIYGVHPVAEALKNPKRKIYSLKASKNAADRLAAEIAARGITPEINAVGSVVLLTSLVLLVAAQMILRRGEKGRAG